MLCIVFLIVEWGGNVYCKHEHQNIFEVLPHLPGQPGSFHCFFQHGKNIIDPYGTGSDRSGLD